MRTAQRLPRAGQQALLACCLLLSATSPVQAHEGGLGNEVMWEACKGRAINDSCSFVNLDHDVYRGSCQSMSNALVCVRNQPIEPAAGAAHAHQHKPAAITTPSTATPKVTPSRARDAWPWLAGLFVVLGGGLALFRMKGKAQT